MANSEKVNTAKDAGNSPTSAVVNIIDDPPPPYSAFEPSANVKRAPPPPSVPPALTREPPTAENRPHITRSPGPRIEDYRRTSFCENLKAICCLAMCWFWVPVAYCVGMCCRECPEPKPRPNR